MGASSRRDGPEVALVENNNITRWSFLFLLRVRGGIGVRALVKRAWYENGLLCGPGLVLYSGSRLVLAII